MLFSLWGIAGTASAAFSSLRSGRRDGDRVLLVHGLANLLVAATTAAVLVRQRRKDNRT
jgi:predicted proteasome-type protease